MSLTPAEAGKITNTCLPMTGACQRRRWMSQQSCRIHRGARRCMSPQHVDRLRWCL